MSEIKANYGKYVSGFQPSDLRLSPVNFWAFTISEADRLLQMEPYEVQVAVEAYHHRSDQGLAKLALQT